MELTFILLLSILYKYVVAQFFFCQPPKIQLISESQHFFMIFLINLFTLAVELKIDFNEGNPILVINKYMKPKVEVMFYDQLNLWQFHSMLTKH